MPSIDMTLRFGDLIMLLFVIVGGTGAFITMQLTLKGQAKDISDLKLEAKRQTDILISLAHEHERINSLEARLNMIANCTPGR
jgi:hypothetical protein